MLVLVDESGDVGFKFAKGSSRLFAVTIILFKDHEEAEQCDLRISRLYNELRLPPKFEFHFHQNSPEIRRTFLRAVAPYKFLYFTVVVDKEKLDLKDLSTAEAFYQYVCGLVFENAKSYLTEATVIIDGSRTRYFKRNLQHFLKKRINDPSLEFHYISKVKIQNSAGNNLLQLADMVCGAVYRSFMQKPDAQDYRKIIAHRQISVQMLPK